MSTSQRHFVPPLLLAAWLSGSVSPAQENTGGRPYLEAVQRAVAEAQARALKDLDVWEDHSTWERAWQVQTDHFLVRTTQSYGDGMQIALGMESMLEHFQQALATGRATARGYRP